MKHYKIPRSNQEADMTLICSINYAIGLVSSFLFSTSRYSTNPSSFHKLGLIYLDLLWPLKLQTYIILDSQVQFTHFRLHMKDYLMCIQIFLGIANNMKKY